MKNIIHKIPFVRLLIALVAGIISGRYLNFPADSLSVFAGGMVLVSLIFTTLKRLRLSFRFRWVHGSIILCTICLIGQMMFAFHEQNVVAMPESEQFYRAVLLEAPQIKTNSIFITVRVTSMEHEKSGKAILYLQKDRMAKALRAGDQLLVLCRFDSIPVLTLPNGFDYAAWMHKLHIVSQAWVSSDNWIQIKSNRGSFMVKFREGVKAYVNDVFRNKIDARGYGLIMALIVGDKRSVDREQKIRFRNAGVLHVMAVSGLHVGILYVFLSGMLFFLKRRKWLQIVRSIIIWTVLGLFAFVAGFSPSVVRAVWMFFLVDAGRLAAKKSSIYNIIAASAFVILVIDPHTVFEAGFWLSYCAVLSIITFFPYLKRLWNPSNKILIKVRDLIALSLSVQPGTAPLSIFLFHQFPAWFLLSNLITIPLVGLIINFSFILLFLDVLSLSMDWMFYSLQFLLDALDYSLSRISNLPMAVIPRLSITNLELALWMTMTSMAGWLLWMREKRLFIPLLILFNVCLMSMTTRKVRSLRTSELMVYRSFGSQGIFLKNGNMGCWIEETPSRMDSSLLEPYISVNGIKHITKIPSTETRLKSVSHGRHKEFIKMQISGGDIPGLVVKMTGQHLSGYADISPVWCRMDVLNASLIGVSETNMPFLVLWNFAITEDVLMVDIKGIHEWSLEDSIGFMRKKYKQNTK